MQHSVSRRAFVGTVLGAGALAVPFARSAGAGTGATTLYQLRANWGAGNPNCVPNRGQSDCGGCYACVNHARNKVFATVAAADAGRAHPRCKCVVAALFAVDPATYNQLFRNGPSVDRRTPGINELLSRSTTPPVAPVSLPVTGVSLISRAFGGAAVVAFGGLLWRAGRMGDRPTSEVHGCGNAETINPRTKEPSQ
jgi:hypothetical protein